MKYLLIFLCTISAAHAQLKDFDITIDSRYDRIQDEDQTLTQNRLQDRIRIGFLYDVNGKFEIVGLAATGPSYGNDWNNAYDFNQNSSGQHELYFRKLYLQKLIGNTQVQLGSLGGIDSVGSAGVSSSGWVDGVNLNVKKDNKNFHIRVGSLYDVQNPSVFTRHRKLNFVEVELSQSVLKDMLVSIGYEHYRDDFIKGKMDIDLSILGNKVLSLIANVLYNVEENAYNYDLGVKWDILKSFIDGHDNYLKLDVYYSHLDPRNNFRNNLYSAYFQDGNSLVFKLSGKVDKNGKMNWFMRSALGKKSRFDVGLSIKLTK
jgi:hypothetical protein